MTFFIQKLPRDMEDDIVLMNAKWETIAHKIFFLNMHKVNRLVVSNPCNYNLRNTLNVIVSGPRIELGRSRTLIYA